MEHLINRRLWHGRRTHFCRYSTHNNTETKETP